MNRKKCNIIAAVLSLLMAFVLAGCGSSNKEGISLGGAARVADEATCRVCHAASIDPVSGTLIVQDFLTSVHNAPDPLGCQGCHGGGAQHNGVGPIPFPDPLAANRCILCHTAGGLAPPQFPAGGNLTPLFELAKAANGGFVANGCANCHTASRIGSVHGAQVPTTQDCVLCHSVAAPNHGASLVNDNNGVRAITGEFAKWSHHVTGVTLNAAHCTACHMEGSVVNGQLVIDQTRHMVDNKIHLRDTTANTDVDFAWDPAAPNHSGMDTFCMSCHDANGAVSPMSSQLQGYINTQGLNAPGKLASASNPFGDTISNRYDKMQRPAVTNVGSQFNTTNNSHHGVKGPRYSGNSRFTGVDANGNARRPIASAATFAQNSSATLYGTRSTIYDAGNFNQLYTPLVNAGGEVSPRTGAKNLGDDSTLHCGDCHTVGQWKVGSSTSRDGSATPAAIGAHGSNNEYLLRNSIGTDERHTQNAYTTDALNNVTYTNPNGAFLVCYNCHSYNRYGSIYLNSGALGSHAGEYDVQGRCNGIANTLPFNGFTTGKATDGTQFVSRFAGTIAGNSSPAPYAGEQNPDFGNIFGIQCLNCHNSGIGNAYGGIHGSANNQQTNPVTVITGATVPAGGYYIDGMGNATKIERFLPGLGNAMYVPGSLGLFDGGASKTVGANTFISGGVSRDANWEQKVGNQTGSVGAGCYTLDRTPPTAGVATNALNGTAPSVTGAGGAATNVLDTWGGCDDHNNVQGAGTSMNKRIVRPVTY